ncbi:MAG TPA: hypothetical protein VIM42_07625 [Clostridium sp.]
MVASTEIDKFRRKPLAEGLRKYFTNLKKKQLQADNKAENMM